MLKRWKKNDRAVEDQIRFDPAAETIRRSCTRCGACQTQCAFLTRYGTPGEICDALEDAFAEKCGLAFECSLCGLCGSVCPEKLDPGAWFLSLRRAAVAEGCVDFSRYRNILRYEKVGTSPLFSYYALPDNCDTVFFPGCTLCGTRPGTTWKLFQHLRAGLPSLGIVLDCCTKPSHALGRQDHFDAMLGEMVLFLKHHGIKRVWLACPSCYQVFADYASGIEAETVYDVMDRTGFPEASGSTINPFAGRELVVHDPCPMRYETTTQKAVRSILGRLDISVGKMAFDRRKTVCCGEGGSVGFVDAKLAGNWAAVRKKTAAGRTIVTYCAGCVGMLNRKTPTLHIADLLFYAEKVAEGTFAVATAPLTYFNRLMLKWKLKRAMNPAVTRVRRFFSGK